MTNNGMKKNVNSQADAETHLKYLDGDSYTHIPGLIYSFDDGTNNPFRLREDSNGNLRLSDHGASKRHEILCQYDCEGKDMADSITYDLPNISIGCTLLVSRPCQISTPFPNVSYPNLTFAVWSLDYDNIPDCKWGDWAPCTATCGSGRKYRSRHEVCQPNSFEDEECSISVCKPTGITGLSF